MVEAFTSTHLISHDVPSIIPASKPSDQHVYYISDASLLDSSSLAAYSSEYPLSNSLFQCFMMLHLVHVACLVVSSGACGMLDGLS